MGIFLRASLGVFFFSSVLLQAQTPPAIPTTPPAKTPAPAKSDAILTLDPNKNEPRMDLRALEPKSEGDSIRESGSARGRFYSEDEVNLEDTKTLQDRSSEKWERPAFGFFVGVTNNGITRSMVKKTEDTVLKDKAQELGIGLGFNLDFGLPSTPDASLRFQTTVYHIQVKTPASVKGSKPPSAFEDTETLFNFALLYRESAGALIDFKTFWYGFGAQLNYIFMTGRTGNSATPTDSKLGGSYSLSPILAIGIDAPVSTFEDLGLSFFYMPWRGFSFHVGFRTSL